ncbi:unnamed protein product [Trichobilharzia szidati]|nr:unnamed protein product [Trichobilharzia szidati]
MFQDDGFLTKNFLELRKRLLRKILEIIYCSEDGDIPVPVSTKLYESLIWLYFKTPELWIHPLKWIVYAFVYGAFDFDITDKSISDERILDGIDKSTYSKQIIENTLRLLSTISEDFTPAKLPHSVKCIITQAIQSDESLVQKILMQFVGRTQHEDVCAFAMHTCGLWIASFVTSSSSAAAYLHLIHTVYTSMHCSVRLYLAGINCLINIFESDGGGLNSVWETAALLDFHICQLVKLKSTLQDLVELYSVNLQKCGRMNELKSYEPLAKTALLFSIFTDKQMDYLMHKLTLCFNNNNNAQNTTETIRELFSMLLLIFSLPGSYPYDEDVSDIALQIWLNAQEVSISSSPMMPTTLARNNSCLSSSSPSTWTAISPANSNDDSSQFSDDIIKLMHKEFNQLAFNKSRYPKDVNCYLNVWKSEDRCRWLKFRQELSESFLAAFRYLNITDWYTHAQDQFSWIVNNSTNEELLVNWQDIEALLFVLLSISEQVLYENASGVMVFKEFAKSISISLIKFMNRIQQLIAYYAINDTMSENRIIQGGSQIYAYHPQCLILFKTLLLCFEKYYTIVLSVLRSSGQNECLECLHVIVNILISTTEVVAYKDEVISLRHSALQILQTMLEHKSPFSLQSSISLIASALEHLYSRSRPLDPTSCNLLFYCTGLLLRSPENAPSTLLSLRNIISDHLQYFVELCTPGQSSTELRQFCVSTSAKSPRRENSTLDKFEHIATVMKIFTQMFRGYTAVGNEITHKPVHGEMLSILNKIYFYSKNSLEIACPHIPKYFKQYHKLLRMTLRIFTQVYESGDIEGIKTVTSELVQCILMTFNYLLNNYNDIFNDSVLKAVQCFLEWLFNNYRENTIGQGVLFLYYAYSLLTLFYEKLDEFLCKQAKLMDNKDVLLFNVSIGYTPADCIHHPISPVIMGFTAQLITSEIEAVSRFLRGIISFDFRKEAAAAPYCKNVFDLIHQNIDVEKAMKFLDITMTLAFSGISVPEWTTVESCLRLVCDLLAILNRKIDIGEVHISHRYTISDQFLFEINACLLLVLAKGGLPQRLATKYAELYASLAKLSPDRQFALLNHILVADSTTTTTTTINCEGQIPHCSKLIEIVRQSIPQSINIGERKSFITTVSRPSMPMQRIRQSISTFVHLLSQRK